MTVAKSMWKMKESTRIQQHKKLIVDKKLDLTGVSDHASTCKVEFDWEGIVLKTKERDLKGKCVKHWKPDLADVAT